MSKISNAKEFKSEETVNHLKNGTRPTLQLLASSTPMHPLDNYKDSSRRSSDSESLDWEQNAVDSCSNIFSSNSPLHSGVSGFSGDEEEDKSLFEAVLSPDCSDVRLRRECAKGQDESSSTRKRIQVDFALLAQLKGDSDNDSPFDNSVLERLERSPSPIPELSAEEEAEESRAWRLAVVGGVETRVDMRVIEPYKRVLSHGGYLSSGSHNAIIVFSACFLPHRTRVDYSYVMDNLFSYVVATLDQLVTDDYVLVYLHGATTRDCVPTFSWLKRCYQLIDRKLRKNLKNLYLVHPTFLLKTIVLMMRPFVSSKFTRKIQYVNSLSELYDTLPLEQACIPEKVNQYDRIKQSIPGKH